MNDMTQMLEAIHRGDDNAAEELLTLVYRELRTIAAAKMSMEPAGHTLQPTALVHEVWLRLMGNGSPNFTNRAHFFGAAAEAMRRILVERARRRHAQKRNANIQSDLGESLEVVVETPSEEMLKVHDALDDLALQDPVAADFVKLRYFVGMNMQEASSALNIPLRSAERLWSFARAWLRRQMARGK